MTSPVTSRLWQVWLLQAERKTLVATLPSEEAATARAASLSEVGLMVIVEPFNIGGSNPSTQQGYAVSEPFA